MQFKTFVKAVAAKNPAAVVKQGYYTQGRTFGKLGVTIVISADSALYYPTIERAVTEYLGK